MQIEIPKELIEKLQLACSGYDIPCKQEEMAKTIQSILIEWIERM
jgi:hypothetical protein